MARLKVALLGLSLLLGACGTLTAEQRPGTVASTAACSTTNIAQGKPSLSSTNESNGTLAAAAFDGDATTRWSSAFTDSQWLRVDLGSTQPICGVTLVWEAAYATAFGLEVSNDGTTWTPVYSTTTGTGGTQNITPSANASGRYVRMLGQKRATPYGYSLFEFKVFGNGTTPPPATSGAACFFEHNDYGGASFCADADSSWVGDAWNDRISSVRVQSGFQVQLFNDINYGGGSKTLTGDAASLPDFNDRASSFKVTRTGTNPCNAPTWTPGVSYRLGDVVFYPANGRLYRVVNVTAGGTDATDPTISTWYWQPTTCTAPEPPPGPTPPTGSGKVVGTYYATFAGSVPRLKDIDPNYNLIYLFAATQAGGEPAGTLTFAAPPDGNGAWTNWAADMQVARRQGRKIILSAGGANEAIRFTDRGVSTRFVDSVVRFYEAWGGFDGLDFNTFEADADPNTPEMIWVAKELKRRYPGFLITAPPAPWNPRDQKFCKDMLDAGALDYCAPQYYDGPDLSSPDYLLENIKLWMDLLGPSNVVVGFGVNNELNNYWTVGSAVDTFKRLEARYPNVRGVFDWRLDWDARDGYPFAKQLGPLVTD